MTQQDYLQHSMKANAKVTMQQYKVVVLIV